MRIVIFAAAAAALIASAGAASAQAPDPAAIIARMDTNKDGALQKDEAQGRLAERFDAIDANKDGKVTAEELTAAFAAMRQQQGGQ